MKQDFGIIIINQNNVAPLAGAWIETGDSQIRWAGWQVAPLAGAWIKLIDY